MCKGFSMICTEKKVCWSLKTNHHEKLVKEYKLDDSIRRKIVRVEFLPKANLMSVNIEDWEMNIDEMGTLPEWFCPEAEKENGVEILKNKIFPAMRDKKYMADLDLRGTDIKSLGDLHSVGENLYLERTQINKKTISKELMKKCIFQK